MAQKNNKNKQNKQQQPAGKKSVADKTAQQKKKYTEQKKKNLFCCNWTFASIFVVVTAVGLLCIDTEINGKGVFARSATGKLLKNAGLLPYAEKAWYTSMSGAARGYKWVERNLPPFCKLACDMTKLVRNIACNIFTASKDFINAKLPVAAEFLEQYVPGLPNKIENASDTVKSVSLNLYEKILAFFQTQVLVGRFSPENLSKAMNHTQNLALEYFNLFHKKVDAYAKLK